MKPEALATTPVGWWLLQFVDPERLTDATEAWLYRQVVDAAVNVTSLGVQAVLDWCHQFAGVELDLAKAVVHCNAARWWTTSWNARPQVWLARDRSFPEEGTPSRRLPGKPAAALWTSSAITGLPSAFWPVLEGLAGEWIAWEISVKSGLRVFELRSPSDWQWLCERFGTVVDALGLLCPDWDAVMGEFDGVHLSTEGLIRTQGVPIALKEGSAMMWGWDAECTAWFRWPVVAATSRGPVIAGGTSAADPASAATRRSSGNSPSASSPSRRTARWLRRSRP